MSRTKKLLSSSHQLCITSVSETGNWSRQNKEVRKGGSRQTGQTSDPMLDHLLYPSVDDGKKQEAISSSRTWKSFMFAIHYTSGMSEVLSTTLILYTIQRMMNYSLRTSITIQSSHNDSHNYSTNDANP